MRYISIILCLFFFNLTFADNLENFPLACICDKSINALKYFDCKQKVSGTQLNVIDSQVNKNIFIFSSFDEKKYQLVNKDQLNLMFEYDTQDYISSILIKKNLDLIFSISYKKYNKKWAYYLKCVSIKKD